MRTNNSDLRERGRNISLYIFECVMAVLYIIISYTLLFTGLFKDSMMSDNVRIGLGIIFGGYGIYRVIRAVKKSLKK
ncbi:MAG: hypothetical protein FWF54_04735 [Candidatus Azobacteroides sp.]|nr:hypothetical protein [Candidatus Azobacteroides sp.]